MKLGLSLKIEKAEILTETVGIPTTGEMKSSLNKLRKVCGKSVNEKIREFMAQLISENKDLLDKAS